jgi:hypothetical protein
MWWSPQEEALQQQAEAAWGVFPAAQPGLPDIAEDFVEVLDDLGDLEWEPVVLDEEEDPPRPSLGTSLRDWSLAVPHPFSTDIMLTLRGSSWTPSRPPLPG